MMILPNAPHATKFCIKNWRKAQSIKLSLTLEPSKWNKFIPVGLFFVLHCFAFLWGTLPHPWCYFQESNMSTLWTIDSRERPKHWVYWTYSNEQALNLHYIGSLLSLFQLFLGPYHLLHHNPPSLCHTSTSLGIPPCWSIS